MAKPQQLIAGNWKMNGLSASLSEAKAVAAGLSDTPARVAICPSATLVAQMAWALKGTAVAVGGQDCRSEASGAFTGDVAAEQLADAGATMVILGHSERRAGYGETDGLVATKVEAALRAGLEPIVCVGETLDQRKAGEALSVVASQVRGSLPAALAGRLYSVAYEPVWAIGTGRTATPEQAQEVHAFIRRWLVDQAGAEVANGLNILYGGSVTPGNIRELAQAPDIDGALVGGASLKAESFLQITAMGG